MEAIKITIIRVAVFAICLAVGACGHSVEPPELHGNDATNVNLMTVGAFKQTFWQEEAADYSVAVVSTDGRTLRVTATVLANGAGANPRGRLIVGDATGALAIDVATAADALAYDVGQNVQLAVEGLYAGRRGSMFVLGDGSALSSLSGKRLGEIISKVDEADAAHAEPVGMPLARLDEDDALLRWQCRLVRLDYVCFDAVGDDGRYPLREANGAVIPLVAGAEPDFGWNGLTYGVGSVTGIISTVATPDGPEWIIMPRSGDDISGFTAQPDDSGDNDDSGDGGDDSGDDDDSDPNAADLSTLNNGKNATGYSGTYESRRGWIAKNCAIASGGEADNPEENVFSFMGDASVRGPILNGRIGGLGSLVSPVISGGISRIEFCYGFPFEERKTKFTVNLRRDGAVVLSTSVIVENIEKRHVYSFAWDVESAGDVVIEILNDGYSASSGDKDRLAVWDVRWVPSGH